MQQIRPFQRFVAGVSLSVTGLLAGCAGDPPEQAVRHRVEAMQAAIDARDAGAIADLLAAAVFLRHRDVGAALGPVDVELRGDSDAVARFTVLATGGSGGLLPERGQVYRVETGWRRIDGDWKLLNANWTPTL